MPSLTRWTWVWISFGIWWCTGMPGVLQSMRLQRVGHNWVTELSWTGTVMALLGVSFHLLIKDQDLVLSVILVPSDSDRFILYAWAMSFFQKLCPAPFSPVTPVLLTMGLPGALSLFWVASSSGVSLRSKWPKLLYSSWYLPHVTQSFHRSFLSLANEVLGCKKLGTVIWFKGCQWLIIFPQGILLSRLVINS